MPDAITARLLRFGSCTPALAASTRSWVEKNLTLESIRATDWLFMNYHAHDYFFQVDDFPAVEELREATIANILRCAEAAPVGQQEDGGWQDEHGLTQRWPWTTICSLLTLRAYGRLG